MYIVLYHGTTIDGARSIQERGILLAECNALCDFARGFYTTPDIKFAKETGTTRARGRFTKPDLQYAVLIYELPDVPFPEEIRYKTFLLANDEWARFVVANRCGNERIRIGVDHNHDARYDIVSGHAADGKRGYLTTLCNDISVGRRKLSSITTADVYPANSPNWGTQMSFHTSKSLEYLKLLDIEYYDCKEGA